MPIALFALAIGAFGIGLTEFVIMGLLNEISADLGISISTAGSLISGYALGVVLGAPLLTMLMGKWSHKNALLWLMGIFIIGNLACAIAPNYETLMLARIITAFAHGTFFGIGSVVATNLVPDNRKAAAISIMFTGLTLANMLGVPFGTWIGNRYSWRLTFYFVVLIGIIAFAIILFLVPKDENKDIQKINWASEFGIIFKSTAPIAMFVTVLAWAGVFGVFTYISPILTNISGFSQKLVSPIMLVFGLGLVIGNIFGGYITDKNVKIGVLLTLVLLMVSLLIMQFAIHGKWSAILLIGFMGATGFATASPLQTWVLSQAKGAGQSLISSLNIAGFNLGNAIGAYVGGLVIDSNLGLGNLPIAAAIFPALAIILSLIAFNINKSKKSIQYV